LPLLADRLGHATCESFLGRAQVVDYDGETLTLGLLNEFARNWLMERYPGAIDACLSEILHQPLAVVLTVVEAPAREAGGAAGSGGGQTK
jgi:chromosomal replication initiation ATPase DnaA